MMDFLVNALWVRLILQLVDPFLNGAARVSHVTDPPSDKPFVGHNYGHNPGEPSMHYNSE